MLHVQRLRIASRSRSQRILSLYPQRRWVSSNNNYKVAIVGSGPSGCYTAKYLQAAAAASSGTTTTIDVLESLPTPFGLVRSGVAPDHPEVKNVQNDFTALFEENKKNEGSNKSSISFCGNVTVGTDVSLHELRQLYDIVVLAYGCESDRKLSIPGEDALSSSSSHHHGGGVLSAREFVAWYNGHPDFGHIGAVVEAALSRVNQQEQVHAVVIGHGNVALDCARILAKGRPGLIDTDISDHALSVIGDGVHTTTVVGRRGHIQGAFTIKEVRELTKLDDASFLVLEDELDSGTTNASLQELEGPTGRPKKRIDRLLRETAASISGATEPKAKQVALRFLLSPVRFEASKEDPSILGAVVCERTKLEGEARQQQAVGMGEFVHLPAQLALVSVGYKGVSMPGLEDWFDKRRGVVTNTHGKVSDSNDTLGGLYVSGWLKRGPSGIIGTNIADAKDTVASIVKDLETLDATKTTSLAAKSSSSLTDLLTERQVKIVDWEAYQRINAVETANVGRKRSTEQPRAKIPTREELLETAFES